MLDYHHAKSSPIASSAAERQATFSGQLQVSELVADVQSLYKSPANASAFFQVASPFNLAAMVSPAVPAQFTAIILSKLMETLSKPVIGSAVCWPTLPSRG